MALVAVVTTALLGLAACGGPGDEARREHCGRGAMCALVPAAYRCPSEVDPGAPFTSTTETLVGSTAVDQALVCRYADLVPPGTTETAPRTSASQGTADARALVTDPSTIGSLVAAIQRGEPMIGDYACPADRGDAYLVRLLTGGTPVQELWVRASGCATVESESRGHFATPDLLARLASLTG